MPLDLDAYLVRLGYAGPRMPTVGLLAEILRRHVTTIPFENLDILLGRPICIDLPAVERTRNFLPGSRSLRLRLPCVAPPGAAGSRDEGAQG